MYLAEGTQMLLDYQVNYKTTTLQVLINYRPTLKMKSLVV